MENSSMTNFTTDVWSNTSTTDTGTKTNRFSLITATDRLAVSISFTVIALLGLTFNSISLAVLRSGKHSNKSTRIQLLNQAASDLLMSLVCPPRFIVRELAVPLPDSAVLCKLVAFTSESVFLCSVVWNATISVERFIAVYYPLKILSYNKKHKIAVAVSVWTLSMLINVDSLVTFTTHYAGDRFICVPKPKGLLKSSRNLSHVIEALPYITLSLTMITMYVLIALKLIYRKYIKNNLKDRNEDPSDPSGKVIKMLAADALVTLITWTGTYLTHIILATTGQMREFSPRNLFIISQTLNGIVLTNCFSTPLVYFLFNRGYRADVRRLISRGFRGESPTELYYSSIIHRTSVARQLSTGSNRRNSHNTNIDNHKRLSNPIGKRKRLSNTIDNRKRLSYPIGNCKRLSNPICNRKRLSNTIDNQKRLSSGGNNNNHRLSVNNNHRLSVNNNNRLSARSANYEHRLSAEPQLLGIKTITSATGGLSSEEDRL